MDKVKVIETINQLGLDKNEFYVLGSSALVLRNILDDSNDIDLAISPKLYKKLENEGVLTYLGTNHNSKWYRLNDEVECCVEELDDNKVEYTDPFNLINLKYYYAYFIKDSTREKDLKKKEILEEILYK